MSRIPRDRQVYNCYDALPDGVVHVADRTPWRIMLDDNRDCARCGEVRYMYYTSDPVTCLQCLVAQEPRQ